MAIGVSISYGVADNRYQLAYRSQQHMCSNTTLVSYHLVWHLGISMAYPVAISIISLAAIGIISVSWLIISSSISNSVSWPYRHRHRLSGGNVVSLILRKW